MLCMSDTRLSNTPVMVERGESSGGTLGGAGRMGDQCRVGYGASVSSRGVEWSVIRLAGIWIQHVPL